MTQLDPAFLSFLESAPDAIIVVDRGGRMVGLNSLAEAMFGYGRDELIGETVELLVPQRFRENHVGQRRDYTETPRTRPMGPGKDLWGRRKSGIEFPVQISLSPIRTKDETFVTSIVRDVTVQRAAEDRFRALLESAPDGIVVVDEQARIVIVNSQTERLFGYTRTELLGRTIEMLVPDRFHERHIGDREAYISDPKLRPMGAGRSLTGKKKSGEEFPVEISLSPLVTDQGRLVMSIVRDISERRAAEEIIRASLREKEAMLKEIHHRVKNNLQVTSSLIRLQAASIADSATQTMFVDAERRIQSMALVHEKLYGSTDLSRIDFADYIRSLSALLFRASAFQPGNVALEFQGHALFLSIEAAVPCGLIVNELISNALKHAFPEGKGRIDVILEESEDEQIRLTISDDGIGLPATLGDEHGSTLGLRLVRALAQQIGGDLVVTRPSKGTSFTLTFPLEGAR
jgi:PAS domain S-box-containing protein